MTQLVIVESAAKAKTIEKYLQSIPELQGKGAFKVMACLGHIRDLPSKEIGVDTNTWTMKYVVSEKKTSLVKSLKVASKEASIVYLASDLDFEGEAIAQHLKDVLNLPRTKYHRVRFNEITKNALKEAFLNPQDIDDAQVQAQETRRILDRMVGYELSPLLWRRFRTSSLSAGRVQTIALWMLIQRKREIDQHNPESYWKCDAIFVDKSDQTIQLPCSLQHIKKIHRMDTYEEVEALMLYVPSVKKWAVNFSQKDVKKSPSPPFITSTLQQEAYERFSLPTKRTMQIAQALYEAGFITYMRTDSTNLSKYAQSAIEAWVKGTFGDEMFHPRQYATKNAHAQEAHEAIRPTDVSRRSIETSEKFTSTHQKVYELIWKRTIASQMKPALYAEVSYDISTAKWKDFCFHGKTQILMDEGFMRIYNPELKAVPEKLGVWKDLITSSTMQVIPMRVECLADVTKPLSHYCEASLVKAMEKDGIGRPSTYASVIDKLLEKGYAYKGANPQCDINVQHFRWCDESKTITSEDAVIHIGGKETDRMVPSSLGERVCDYVQTVMPSLLDVSFTSDMEQNLDNISNKLVSKHDVLSSFYGPFHDAVTKEMEVQQSAVKAPSTTERKPKSQKDFPDLNADIVDTRYGPALYHRGEKRFVSLSPFLEWKQKGKEDITCKDATFLLSLPLSIEGTARTVAYGRYGLYVKDGNANIPLPRDLWDLAYEGLIAVEHIKELQPKSKPSWKRKGSASAP